MIIIGVFMNEELCTLEMKDGWVYVVLPDGRKIPGQRGIEVKQDMPGQSLAMVKVELIVNVKQ